MGPGPYDHSFAFGDGSFENPILVLAQLHCKEITDQMHRP